MIDLNLPYTITPTSPATEIQANFDAFAAWVNSGVKWPGGVCSCDIEWADLCKVPIENLPMDEIIEEIGNSSVGLFIASFGFVGSGLVIQYRDDTHVYATPGQVMHRGVYKRQPLDSVTGKNRVIDVPSVLRDPAADGDPTTTSGLFPDTWYYWYAKLDVAQAYPDYRVSKLQPTNADGYGLECPSDTKLRYLGAMRTGPGPDAFILAYHRYESGRYFWRELDLGPETPTHDVNVVTAGYAATDVSSFAPPTADIVFCTSQVQDSDGAFIRVRATGDTTDPSGYDNPGDADTPTWCDWMEVPVNTLDPATDDPQLGTTIDLNSNFASPASSLAVVGFHEPIN